MASLKVEYLKLDKEDLGRISSYQFKRILKMSFPRDLSANLEAFIVESLETEYMGKGVIQYDILQKFTDLYQFIPTNTKHRKDKNFSPNMYKALTRTKSYNQKPKTKQD